MKKILASLTACLLCIPSALTAKADGVSRMNSLLNNYGGNCAVMVWSPIDGTLYASNQDLSIYGASLIKLSYACFACTQIDAGVHSLDETMTYTSGWYHGGSGIIAKNGYGNSYTIRQLLDYAMRYSDNVAYDMLVYLFGTDGFNQMVSDWGYSVSIGTPSPRFPSLSADFMRYAMHDAYTHRNDSESRQAVWEGLINSQGCYARAVFSEDTAIKYGYDTNVYHEACLVDGDYPYIAIFMTSISSGSRNPSFIRNLATASEEIVSDFLAECQFSIGDVNLDGKINAVDASDVLQQSALCSAGNEGIFTERQKLYADLNADGAINARDASLILQFSADYGAGNIQSIEVFLEEHVLS